MATYWSDLPVKIDAAYENPVEEKTVFFSGTPQEQEVRPRLVLMDAGHAHIVPSALHSEILEEAAMLTRVCTIVISGL